MQGKKRNEIGSFSVVVCGAGSEMAVHGAANQNPCLVFLSGGCRRVGWPYPSPQKKRRKGVEPNSGTLPHSVVGGLLSRIS